MRTSTTTNSPAVIAQPVRYSAADLAEFEALLKSKLGRAEEDLRFAKDSLLRDSSNGTDDTYFGNRGLDDGSPSLEREELMMLAARQEKFITDLQAALSRLRAGNYGVCRVTGQLIPKERLRLVPHATTCIAAKTSVPPPNNH